MMEPSNNESGQNHLELAKQSLRDLLQSSRIPQRVRESMQDDYQQIQNMLDKLEYGHIHIAVFGRVSVGKSAILNALLGEEKFSTSPLHGETTKPQWARWEEVEDNGVFLIDTPGINEIKGEDRERMAHEVAGQSDLVLFLVDGDITDTEQQALTEIARENRPILLVLNKSDRYSQKERELILESLVKNSKGIVPPENIICSAAQPSERIVIQVDMDGNEEEIIQQPAPDIIELKDNLWRILEHEGKTLSALNATLFAGKLSDQVAQRIIEIKRDLSEKVVHHYCIIKGITVAVNPLPIADLIAVSAVDIALVIHLGKIYGINLSKRQAGKLLKTIITQITVIMGAVWGVHIVSSALKGSSLGLSTIVTASIQGAVAYYSTFIVGKAAEEYFAHGQSWGDAGPKKVVETILDSLNRDSIIDHARSDIASRLKS